MKSGAMLVLATALVGVATWATAEDSKAPASGDGEAYGNTFKETPGMRINMPKDIRLKRIGGGDSFEIESPQNYISRKVEAQNKQLSVFQADLDKLSERVTADEEKIKLLEGAIQPVKKPEGEDAS